MNKKIEIININIIELNNYQLNNYKDNQMDKLEKFFTHILEKQEHKEIQIIERDCKDIFAHTVLTCMKSNDYKGTIDIGNLMQMIYDELLQQKILIVCLMFSDGNKIHIEKTELCNILYFKNIFETQTNNGVYVEFQLPTILDDYEIMKRIIDFIHYGVGYFINNTDLMYKLTLIDRHLGEIKYPKCIRGRIVHGNKCGSNTLYTFLQHHLKNIWTLEYRPESGFPKNRYDIAYDLCVMLKQDMNCVKINDSIINYNSGFIGSKLHMNLCENEKKRVDEKILLFDVNIANK